MGPDSLQIVIYGAGAVGGYLGGRLTQSSPAGAITLVGRDRLVAGIAEHGLIVREHGSEVVTRPRAVTSSMSLAPVDLVILAVRTYDVATSIPDIRHLMGDHGVLLAMQNGIGTEDVLARELGPSRVLAGTLTVSAGMEEPAVITRYSRSGGVALSSMDGSPVRSYFTELFAHAGLPTIAIGDYRSLRWSKLLLNMLAASTSAILDMDIDLLMDHPQIFRLEQFAFREAGRVMDALGISTVALPGYPVPRARLVMRLPGSLARRTLGRRIAAARGGRSPGMRTDLTRGKSEIGAFNRAVVQAAAPLGLKTPVNAALSTLMEELVAHSDRRTRYRGRPDALVQYARSHGIRL